MSAAARLEPVAFSISRLAAFTSAEEVSKQTVLPLIRHETACQALCTKSRLLKY